MVCSRIPAFIPFLIFLILSTATSLSAGQGLAETGGLAGKVLDSSGAVLPAAAITLVAPDGTTSEHRADAAGRFSALQLPAGEYRLLATSPGFAILEQRVVVPRGATAVVSLTLTVGGFAEAVQVSPERLVEGPELSRRIPGSFTLLDLRALETSRVFTTNEVLRKSAGVAVREEEGLGLRPNIGIRGLNPTRSSRVLLLEDGIPLTYAPYGDNAAYYHPPIERFESVEVLKGSGQIAYGPMTVGGVINYITPAPPAHGRSVVAFTAGSRAYGNAHAGYGTTSGATGVVLDYMRKQGDGARENVHSDINDFSAKVVRRLTNSQVLTLRGSYYGERSNNTYSGLREPEYRDDPRQNPFENDVFYVDRAGSSATHNLTLGDHVVVTTSAYASIFKRDWWRQSSNSAQRPNDAADAACAGMPNLNTTCGNEGRLRDYLVLGVEPRARTSFRTGALWHEVDLGVRVHTEDQERRQENGDTPTSRSGRIVENNERGNKALAAFVQNRLVAGSWSFTPGIRVEHVEYERTNRLLGVTGTTSLTKIIPGVGIALSPTPALTVFAGAHRGFAPPRTEDIISNTTGGAVDLDPELSWNYEAGVRGTPRGGVQFDAAFFRMDYENQVVPATLAGGLGATLTNAGQTRHQGFEATVRLDAAGFLSTRHNVYLRTAVTAVPTATFAGTRYSSVAGFNQVSVNGNRLPYAPEWTINATAGYSHPAGVDLTVEASSVSHQFADDLNTVEGSSDGQRGLIPAHTTFNAAANYRVRTGATVFVAVKNLLDRTYIVDRSRGLLPGMPRVVHGGVKLVF
jgi:Fe(3+) dicitrate transport protein